MEKTIQNPTTDNQGVKSDPDKAVDNASVELTGNENNTVENVPYGRFNEVTKQKRELEAKLKAYEAQQEENRVKVMEEQGKFKELNTELSDKLKTYEDKLNVYAEIEAKEREDLLSQLDDQEKEVYGSLNNGQLKKHLSKVQPTPTAQTSTTQPTRDVSGKKVTDWTTLDKDERRSNWDAIVKSFKK